MTSPNLIKLTVPPGSKPLLDPLMPYIYKLYGAPRSQLVNSSPPSTTHIRQ